MTYEQISAEFDAVAIKFNEVRKDFMAFKITDEEFDAARAEYKAALDKFDEAYAKAAGWTK